MYLTTAHIKKDHYATSIKAGKNAIIADEPRDLGGTETGLSPDELLLAALSACTAITLRMYADRKGWQLDEVMVHCTLERNREKNTTQVEKQIELIGDLSEDERKRMMVIADKCPTHQLLTHPINISSRLL